MVIDFHAHVYPEKIAAKAVENIGAFYGMKLKCRGITGELLEIGAKAGIGHFVLLGAAQTAAQVPAVNNFIAAAVAAAPGNYSGFGALHPELPDAQTEIERMIALGLKGVKLHPDMQRVEMDSPAMMSLYALLEGRLPLVFHAGDFRTDYSHPRRLARVLDVFPGLTVIAAHLGGWSIFDAAVEYLQNRSCFLDISSVMDFTGKARLEELIRIYGAERILFASDYPMYNPAEELERFNTLNLSAEERALILHQNARRILSRSVGGTHPSRS